MTVERERGPEVVPGEAGGDGVQCSQGRIFSR